MRCPNPEARYDWDMWICLHARPLSSAREQLAKLWNGWLLIEEIDRCHAYALRDDVTEEACEEYLCKREIDASMAASLWRQSQ